MPDDEDFLQSLRATFRIEAAEHVGTIGAGLLALETTLSPELRQQTLETVFRAAHSLKGAARAVDFAEVERICQALEDLFAGWRREAASPAAAALDSAHRSLDAVNRALNAGDTRPAPAPPPPRRLPEPPRAQVAPLVVPAPRLEPSPAPPPARLEPAAAPAPVDTVRISVAKLDARLLEAEEMLTAKLITRQREADLASIAGQFEEWRKEWIKVQPLARSLRQTADRADGVLGPAANVPRLLDFFDWSHDYLRAVEGRLTTLHHTAGQDHLVVAKLVDDLLEDSKKLLMLPLSTMSGIFPRLVRDLCRDEGKEAGFTIQGDEVEIDKRILEEMKDPLIHLLRNSIDHGIEPPEERVRQGKARRASIVLALAPVSGTQVELLVSDDGQGIDAEKVKASALKQGRISAEQAAQMPDSEAIDLIFQSEVSTSPIITQLSGRGLGLAIVRENAEKLGGSVTVETRPGAGTTVRITLPTALATFRGILARASGRLYVIPTLEVERVARCRPGELRTVEGRETLAFDGRAVPVVWLEEVLELPKAERHADPGASLIALVLGAGEQRIAFVVEEVLAEQEVLVKRLAPPLVRVRNVAGATVLGSGQVAPILNVSDLLKSARRAGQSAPRHAEGGPARVEGKSILIAEDSITSRMLLKGILESAGYRVKTAVDGLEAFTALRAEPFDLLVSDVEMPRLNGFDLTARVRADRKLAELPVILVTALESREHRERGVDVGASAYLVKSSFDQSNLLEAVRRLA
jgi:two-component system chemotaxis sensor kinase CheA